MIQLARKSYFSPLFLTFLFTLLAACTNESSPVAIGAQDESSVGAKPLGSKASPGNSRACGSEDLLNFEKPEGIQLDLDREALPKGLYLATVSDLYLEKRWEANVFSRLLAREVAGSKSGEIICSENMARLSPSIDMGFDMAIQGIVKFDTISSPFGGNFTGRQFYVFSDRGGHGVILSNPELDRPGLDLKKLLNSGSSRGLIQRVSSRQYVIRLSREQDGVRLRIAIRLDFISNQ